MKMARCWVEGKKEKEKKEEEREEQKMEGEKKKEDWLKERGGE